MMKVEHGSGKEELIDNPKEEMIDNSQEEVNLKNPNLERGLTIFMNFLRDMFYFFERIFSAVSIPKRSTTTISISTTFTGK